MYKVESNDQMIKLKIIEIKFKIIESYIDTEIQPEKFP